jgi:hypothetical protein
MPLVEWQCLQQCGMSLVCCRLLFVCFDVLVVTYADALCKDV